MNRIVILCGDVLQVNCMIKLNKLAHLLFSKQSKMRTAFVPIVVSLEQQTDPSVSGPAQAMFLFLYRETAHFPLAHVLDKVVINHCHCVN